jgi:hypothetical protein
MLVELRTKNNFTALSLQDLYPHNLRKNRIIRMEEYATTIVVLWHNTRILSPEFCHQY